LNESGNPVDDANEATVKPKQKRVGGRRKKNCDESYKPTNVIDIPEGI